MNQVNSNLWYGTEQLINAGVAIRAWLKVAAGKLAVGARKLSQEDLVVVVSVEQGTDTAGKLV